MKLYSYDAFGNPIWVNAPASGELQVMTTATASLYCDEAYDPALAQYYLRVGHHRDSIGRFTSFDNHEGEITDPASLRKFRYAGQTAIRAADPSRTFTLAEKTVCQGM